MLLYLCKSPTFDKQQQIYMSREYPINPQQLREHNIIKYKGIAPSWELIEKVIKRSGLKFQARFELVWGIPHKMLTQVKNGDKELPCKYWHIFYDFDNIKKSVIEKQNTKVKPSPTSHVLSNNKNILDAFLKN